MCRHTVLAMLTIKYCAYENSGEISFLRKVKPVRDIRSVWVIGPGILRKFRHYSTSGEIPAMQGRV